MEAPRGGGRDFTSAMHGGFLLLICLIAAVQCLPVENCRSASMLQNRTKSSPRGNTSAFLLEMAPSSGNVSTYLDQTLTIPSMSFVAGSTVYVKGGGWPAYANITVSFTQGVQGTPVVVATRVVKTDGAGSFASSLKIGSNGPPGVWSVIAEYSPSNTSSTTFTVSLSFHGPPSISVPVLLASLLVAVALIGYFWYRRRVDQANNPNYYSTKD